MPDESPTRERVLTIHGIQTSGDWQEDLARAFAPHFDCKTIKYPHYRWFGPLKLILEPYVLLIVGLLCALFLYMPNPPSRVGWITLLGLLLSAYLATYYRRKLAFEHILRQAGPYARPEHQSETHLIAHSLGTYLMGRALRKRSEFHLGRIVLVGCVLPRSFAWEKLAGISDSHYRFVDVRNEVGRRDVVVWSAWAMSWLIRGLGIAGLTGFKDLANVTHTMASPETCLHCDSVNAPIHNVQSQYMGHSDAFVGSGYAEVFWLPYLWNIAPREYQRFLLFCKAAAGLERPWSAAPRASGIVDPRLSDIEKKFLEANWRWSSGLFEDYVLAEVKSKKTGTERELRELAALAVRGTWQAVAVAVQARLGRQERIKTQLAGRKKSFWLRIGVDWRRHRTFSDTDLVYDPVADEPIRYLDPREAVRRAVERLP